MGKHKKRKHEKKSKKRRSSSDESSSDTEWIEKPAPEQEKPRSTTPPKFKKPELEREEWLNVDSLFASTSTADRRKSRELEKRKKRQEDQYNPSQCSRELNPYWKNGGDGLPTFKKPSYDLDFEETNKEERKKYNWKTSKSSNDKESEKKISYEEEEKGNQINSTKEIKQVIPTSLDPNVIAAKLVKAEIMGNSKLVEELKLKLEEAKAAKLDEHESNKVILLTQTDSKGFSRPVKMDEDRDSRRKKRKVETYTGKERTKYYADDDKYSLKQMFEAEKYNSSDSANKEFAKMASGIKKNDDMEDIFVDKIRHQQSSKDVDKAISMQQKVIKSVDNCTKCLQSESMPKHLMIDYSEYCYISMPSYEPLTDGHCFISPVRHIPCSVQLDENEWSEINNLRYKLVKLFESQDKCVIFFETAKYLHKYPHMVLECIPIPKNKSELAPIYFKKGIEESETEWSHNKKLISLKNRDVIKAVPKGLPYFFVSFGMTEGFAHIIEDQNMFPNNFAQEIIGGMLDIHHSKWRKPRRESFDLQKSRVYEFKKWWKS
ncbi:CWF19-like protein 2 homolog [Coccinella septempunctata]|uniref:CWF19-like protein 2 homolog n=1 Tax=Coccinella septempunctata TaxID=41139 RepID=UPI001D08878C|nr:CWF19-like protein 2 homolog [Coccinella septempunctata]